MAETGIDRIKSIFAEALEKSAEERQSFLENACGGNAALRAEVDAFLSAAQRAGDFLSLPTSHHFPSSVETAAIPLRESAGSVIGHYKLLQLIGEGGFGSVFMAEQQFPVRRKVALKIIKLGMDTKQVIARFEAERQALAMMDHPNIAKVLEAGATESGRPYFVMELVKGVPITEYCDSQNLSTRQRVELFVQVCRAIQHAHQKGVIHRDIKPTNVLVTMHDDKAVPKVIDFGIAKATSHRLTEKTLFTEYRQFIGTPAYMSPEQAQMSGLDIDTRSDIYSLGVLLYELLTGQTPFDPKALLSAAYDELRRIIREVDPPKPSTRISSLGATLTEVARHRSSPPAKLAQSMRGELDWIVMKAMEKDRTRRYETANAMARDLERHLTDEPVAARPASAAYRTRKFVRRHTASVAAGALVLIALLLGICGTTLGLVRAQRNADLVRKEKDQLQVAERRALASEAVAIGQKRATQIELGHRLISEGDALRPSQRWGDAVDRYTRASELLRQCGQSSFEADMGVWECAPQIPLLNSFGDRAVNIACAAMLPDGRAAITGGNDGVLRLWDLLTGREMLTLRGHVGAVRAVAVSPDGATAVSGGADGSARVWDLHSGAELRAFRQHAGSVNAVAIHPDGNQVLSGGEDGILWAWDMQTAHGIHAFGADNPALHEPIWSLCLSMDGDIAVTGTEDWTVRIWNVQSGQLLASRRTPGRGNPIQSLAISPNLRFLVAGEGSIGKKVFKYYLSPKMDIVGMSLLGYQLNATTSLEYSPNGTTVLSGSSDRTLKLWTGIANSAMSFGDQNGPVSAARFSSDGSMVLAAGAHMRLWGLGAGHQPQVLIGEDQWIFGIAISPDGRLAASGGDARLGSKGTRGPTSARIWDLATARTLRILVGQAGPVWSVAFSPDGTRLLSASQDGMIRLWNVGDGKLIRTFNGRAPVRAVAFCNAAQFVSGGDDKFMYLWHVDQDKPLASYAGTGATVLGVAAGGGVIACADAVGTITVASLSGGGQPRRLTSRPETHWRSVGFSSDGKLLAGGNTDGTTDLWDLAGGRLIRSGPAHAGEVTAVAFWPDGSKMVSGGVDGTLAIWDVRDGHELHRFLGSETNDIAISSDGGTLVSGGMARTIQVRDLTLPARCRDLELRLAEGLTRLEKDPNDPSSLAILGQWYALKGWNAWAIELLTRARTGGSDVSSLTLAQCYVKIGNYPAAVSELKIAMRRGEAPASYLQLLSSGAQLDGSEYFALALRSLRAGNPQAASDQLALAIEIEPAREGWWNDQACLLAYLDDIPRYRAHCRAMIERFGGSDDLGTIDHVVKATLLLPGPQYAAGVMRRYDQGIAANATGYSSRWYALAKGMAEYRAGRMSSCIERLSKTRPEFGPSAEQATLDFFVAMAYHKLGRTEESMRTMRQAQATMATRVEPIQRIPTYPENWLIARVAEREAQATFLGDGPMSAAATTRAAALPR